jgi:hypothetical protein
LNFFIENPTKIEVMGRVSKEIIEEYTPQKVAQEMYLGFKRCLK